MLLTGKIIGIRESCHSPGASAAVVPDIAEQKYSWQIDILQKDGEGIYISTSDPNLVKQFKFGQEINISLK